MKNKMFFTVIFSCAIAVFILSAPFTGSAEVNVRVSVPLPPLVISAAPGMVVIPGTNVYYPPDVASDIFFFHGFWYRPHNGQWYWATGYNGPWRGVAIQRVPPAVLKVTPGFRHGHDVHDRLPYGQVKKNWRTWERERRWDRESHERRAYRENEGRRENDRGGREH